MGFEVCCHERALCLPAKVYMLDGRSEPFRRLARRIPAVIQQYNHELLTSPSLHHVMFAQIILEKRRHFLQTKSPVR